MLLPLPVFQPLRKNFLARNCKEWYTTLDRIFYRLFCNTVASLFVFLVMFLPCYALSVFSSWLTLWSHVSQGFTCLVVLLYIFSITNNFDDGYLSINCGLQLDASRDLLSCKLYICVHDSH